MNVEEYKILISILIFELECQLYQPRIVVQKVELKIVLILKF
jgi:hypothetical protein